MVLMMVTVVVVVVVVVLGRGLGSAGRAQSRNSTSPPAALTLPQRRTFPAAGDIGNTHNAGSRRQNHDDCSTHDISHCL